MTLFGMTVTVASIDAMLFMAQLLTLLAMCLLILHPPGSVE